MTNYQEQVLRYWDEQGLTYQVDEDGDVLLSVAGNAMQTIRVSVIFNKSGKPIVHMVCPVIYDIGNREQYVLTRCNQANRESVWTRFYINQEGDVIAVAQTFLDENTCGWACLELLKKFVQETDRAYRILVAEVW